VATPELSTKGVTTIRLDPVPANIPADSVSCQSCSFLPSYIRSRVEVLDGCKRNLQGPEQTVLSDLMDLIKAHDADLILCHDADTRIHHKARPDYPLTRT